MTMQDTNRAFGAVISRLINGNSLSREEAYQAFLQVLDNTVSDMQQGAFLAALTAKKETAEEIAGGWQAIFERDTNSVVFDRRLPLIDNCGTGMDTFKTFNVSTASSLIGAAGGLYIARHGARAISSKCGTVDVAESLGVDVECPVETVAESIRTTGLGLFNGMSPQVHPQALGRILSQINFGSPLNIAASLANPAMPQMAVRGVYSREMLLPVTEVMREIGYTRALVVYGSIDGTNQGIDEASVCGPTYGYLLSDGTITAMEFTPESAGLQRHAPEEIAAKNSASAGAGHLVRLLAGKEKGGAEDIALLNSGLLFFTTGKADSIQEGVQTAKELLASGKPLEKLQQWVSLQNREPEQGAKRLQTHLERV